METIILHFGKVLLLTIWVVCGIVGLVKDPGALLLAALATLGWVLFR